MTTPAEYLSTRKAAQLEGVTAKTIANRCRRGDYPNARRVEPDNEKSAWIIPVSDLASWIDPADWQFPENQAER